MMFNGWVDGGSGIIEAAVDVDATDYRQMVKWWNGDIFSKINFDFILFSRNQLKSLSIVGSTNWFDFRNNEKVLQVLNVLL